MRASLLEHEQIHFDIAAIHARQIRRDFRRVHNPCGNRERLQQISVHNNALLDEMQQSYDRETEHGTSLENQREWTLRIRAQLGRR